MKRPYIIAALLIAAGIFVFINSSKDVSSYASFDEAYSNRVKVVGTLSKDKPMEYDPENKPDEFSFVMKDDKNVEKKVVLQQPKPQDFEMSEQIVVTGTLKDDVFYADEILMKCPSKYKDEEIAVKSNSI
ncbi:MAG: cytochrome c maturation protein CcmE [Saprospiraceae bacterium]|nr:cytochrome c maturation protein CcmE [Saprospiraceae bacterium]